VPRPGDSASAGRAATPERAYLDYAGFAPVDPRVLAVMRPFFEGGVGNPSAPHSLGEEARASLEAARVKVARLCGGAASGVIFTSGATEANNLAIKGMALASCEPRAAAVIVSAIEHESVLGPCRDLERAGARLVVVPVDRDGRVDLGALRTALHAGAALVSIAAASEEIGTLQPIAEIARLARASGAPLHVDAVGALGRVPLGVDQMGIDLLTLSGNDIYGPPGTGALWVRARAKLQPQVLGGGQEGGHRSGTENVPALVGLGVAAELMRTEAAHGESARLAALRDRLMDGLLDAVTDCRVIGARAERLPHHVSIALAGVKADSVLRDLDLAGIAASSGSACASQAGAPAAALSAIGCSSAEIEGSLRFTLGRWSAAADVEAVVDRLPAIVRRVRAGVTGGRC
jgi:cysteine desulfurase